MADNTAIEWSDTTWNPLLGCERVSPGCDGCYAISTATIRAGNPHPKVAAAFEGLTERRDGRLDWTGRINLLPDRLNQPLGWRKGRKVFVNSQSDLFHKDVPLSFIEQVFAVMARTPQHTYQLLTKRHARMNSILRRPTFPAAVAAIVGADIEWPLPNLHLGVSVENQQWADIRVPALLSTPAAVRWLSMEPLLGPVDLRQSLARWWPGDDQPWNGNRLHTRDVLHWVVTGGESGPGARPMHPQWARDLRDQCIAAKVPFFFKQYGAWRPGGDPARAADYVLLDGTVDQTGFGSSIPGAAAMVRVGKKAAGRELDGRTWDEHPAERAAVTA